MPGISEAIPAASTAALFDGVRTEMFVALAGEDGALRTMQFYETKMTLGDVALLRAYDWGRRAPEGAIPFAPEGGVRPEEMKNFWLMWRQDDWLVALSVAQAQPGGLRILPGDHVIDRPLMVADDQLHAYVWRGDELRRFVYRGGIDAPVSAEEVALGHFSPPPGRTICAPVPGDLVESCFLGGVRETPDGLVATGIYVREQRNMELHSPALSGYRFFGRQRLAVHVGTGGQPAVGFLAESEANGGGYAVLTCQFDFRLKSAEWSVWRIPGPELGSLQSAGVFFRKAAGPAGKMFLMYVDRGGRLRVTSGGDIQMLRAGMGPEYSYPVLTTENSRYEVQPTETGVKLVLF